MWAEDLPGGERHPIRVPESNILRGGAKSKLADEHGSGIRTHELSEHGLRTAVHLQTNPADGVVETDRPL